MTDYGTVTYEGKEYSLKQQPFIAGRVNADPYYLSSAIDSEGNEYAVVWELNEHTKEAYSEIEKQRELGETPNYSLVEDESTACDWDNPIDIGRI